MNQKMLQIGLFALSVFVMSTFMGWPLALMIIGMIYFHEVGHQAAAKFFGAKTGGIYMLPMLGGVAMIQGRLTRFEDAVVSLWGPVHGLLFCFAAVAAFYFTGNPLFATAAKYSAFINLFNLLPLGPLDGGRVLKDLAFSFHEKIGKVTMWLGIALSIFLAIKLGSAIMIAIAVLSFMDYGYEKSRRFRSYTMKGSEIFFIILAWVGLFLALAAVLAFI